ncbi:MAG: restriction endonuclease subunit S, partial [Nitrospirota bacterium]
MDTSKWNKVSFGDIAKCLTVATKDPLAEGLNRYVGLEHIEPGNIHIKSWGNIEDGTTFTRVFRKGQVLFGKRRAYQKKAALAEFEGICSSDILVCEAIEDAVIPELLPFIVQSDRFFEHAIKTSAGSLSPRTKFKDLAKLTFRLPSKPEDQKRIADLLWSIDETEQKYFELKTGVNQA